MALTAAIASVAFGQETLTNEGIVNLVKSGMGEELILNVIDKQPVSFSLGANDLVALKNAGVSEKVIAAMLNKSKGGSAATSATSGSAAASSTASTAASGSAKPISAPGLYYRKNNEAFELLSEDVEWKSAGGMKSIASAGIIKKDLKGNIAGPSSRNFLQIPFEILISPPPGMTINDYILLPLRPDKGKREFIVGPVNQKSGVAKGAIPFGVEKVGNNAFRMVFQQPLAPGEYGILSTRAASDLQATNKMFTFRVIL